MRLLNFIIWLSVGAVAGWFASRLVELEKPKTVNVFVNEVEEELSLEPY